MNAYIDFEDVTVGSIVLVEKDLVLNKYDWDEPCIDLFERDIWMVVGLHERPRRATLRNLQRNQYIDIRVDQLLDINDSGSITIGPC